MPLDGDILDPRAFRWVETGVSGLARPREWDASAVVEVRELAGADVAELDFRVLADGSLQGDVPSEAVPALTAELGLDPPFAVRAVRRGDLDWAVAARRLASQPIELPAGIAAAVLEAAVAPDGEPTFFVDGDLVAEDPEGAEAAGLEELLRLGRERFEAFAARADRLEDGRWDLTIDPL